MMPRRVRLGEFIAPHMGSVDPTKCPEELFDLYSIPAFDNGRPELRSGASIGPAKQVVEPDDVLLSRIVPHIRRAWVVGPRNNRRIIASGEWIVFRSRETHPPYLRRLLMADEFHAAFMRTVSGVGGSLLRARAAHVANIEVSFPPLVDQRRIADILDKADALRAKRRAALAQLDALTQSIFLDMFGGGHRRCWPTIELGEISDVQGGLQLYSGRDRLPISVPYLRVANIHRGFLDLSDIKLMRATDAEITRTRLAFEDLLVVEGHGNPSEVGRAALWDGSIAECVHQNHLIRVRFDAVRVIPAYACMYLNSAEGRRHLLRSGKTTSGLNTINVSEVRATPLLVPPPELQARFASHLERLAHMRTALLKSSEALDAFFTSLQRRAFRGEL